MCLNFRKRFFFYFYRYEKKKKENALKFRREVVRDRERGPKKYTDKRRERKMRPQISIYYNYVYQYIEICE